MSWFDSPIFSQLDLHVFPWYVHFLATIAVIVLAFFFGGFLGRNLRMPEHGWKIGVILFSLLASVVILLMGPPLKLGIDLSGGARLIYEVDQTKKPNPNEILTKEQMDNLIGAVARRVNPGGQKEVTIRRYGAEQIEVIVPEKEQAEVERIQRIISRTGSLEFRILANNRDHKELIERALADATKNQILDAGGNRLAWWVPVKEGEEKSISSYGEIALRKKQRAGREVLEVLVVNDIYNVTGAYLTEAKSGTDRQGRPCVEFTFNNRGGQLFGELTAAHLPDKVSNFTYKLGIILDGELYSAPSIQSTIYNRGEITGSFTQEEVQELVNVLNAGSLPAALTKEPISTLFSGPTLGRDTIEKSTKAMLISSILVPLFMLWYYRFCGVVAIIALALNMLMLFAVMLLIKAAFSLTGFAGLALTVGMAVDNNVLIYERLREELQRGAALRMAVRNAFQRASATIIDANLTTIIAATVLYIVGTDQVRGFAVPLWLGVAASIYTSVFVSRVIFDIAEKRQWLKKVKMMQLIGHTDINFMRAFPVAVVISLLLIIAGITVAVYRGQGLFDIDFTGGVSVQALFKEPQRVADVRDQLGKRLPDLAISDAQLVGEEPGLRFLINTSEPDIEKVKKELTAVFGNKLAFNALEFSTPELISPPAAGQEKAESNPPEKTAPKADAKQAAASAARPPAGAAAEPFAGGVRTELRFVIPMNHEAVEETIRGAFELAGLPETTVFEVTHPEHTEGDFTARSTWELKITAPQDQAVKLLEGIQKRLAETPIFPASSTIGTAVAGETQMLATYALVASWLCMIIYLWVRFQGVAFGLAAVVALIHDVLIMLGAVAVSIYLAPFLGFLMIEPFKINLPIVAAFLTIIGFSVNDTIVVFDRIREVRGKAPYLNAKMVNDSVNQTLSRTLLTSFTVLLVVIVLYMFGGEALHGFAFALIVGVITGTYSSVYIAAPILLLLLNKGQKATA